MAISWSHLQDLLGSNGSILMRMVLVFYPSSVTYMAQVILLFNSIIEKVNHLVLRPLQGWIVVVMSKIQKALLLYWQSTMRPLLDPIVEKISNAWEDLMLYLLSKVRAVQDWIAGKMKNVSKALEMRLANDAKMGQPKAKLIGKLALLFATFFLQESELRFKYDKTGVITVCFIFICLSQLTFSSYWRKALKILGQRWACTVNSTLNFTCFILAILFEKFYDNSLRNLGAAFCMAVFTLSLQVVLRPRTDPAFFGFMLGVVGSITHNRFGLKYPTWIIACICFVMFSFKSWLDKHWLDFEEDLPWLSTDTNTIGSTALITTLPYTLYFVTSCIFKPAVGDACSLLSAVCAFIFLGNFFYFGRLWSRINRHSPNDTLSPTRVGLLTRFTLFVLYSIVVDVLYSSISMAYYDGWVYSSHVKGLV